MPACACWSFGGYMRTQKRCFGLPESRAVFWRLSASRSDFTKTFKGRVPRTQKRGQHDTGPFCVLSLSHNVPASLSATMASRSSDVFHGSICEPINRSKTAESEPKSASLRKKSIAEYARRLKLCLHRF